MASFVCLFPPDAKDLAYILSEGIGGALTTPDAITNPDAPKNMVGSAFIIEAESIEQCAFWLSTVSAHPHGHFLLQGEKHDRE